MKFIKENWKGILLCIGLAVPASLLGGQFSGHRRTCVCDPRGNDPGAAGETI